MMIYLFDMLIHSIFNPTSKSKAKKIAKSLQNTKEGSTLDARIAELEAATALATPSIFGSLAYSSMLQFFNVLEDYHSKFPIELQISVIDRIVREKFKMVFDKPDDLAVMAFISISLMPWVGFSDPPVEDAILIDIRLPSFKQILKQIHALTNPTVDDGLLDLPGDTQENESSPASKAQTLLEVSRFDAQLKPTGFSK
jgi:hypothetical protein